MFRVFKMRNAPKSIASPPNAADIHFFASEIPSGLPADALYLMPPYMMIPRARITPIPMAVL